jgi:hypothetical protein
MDLRRGSSDIDRLTFLKFKLMTFKNEMCFFTALDRVRADFHSDTESFCGNQSDIFTSLAQGAVGSPGEDSPVDSSGESVNNSKNESLL